MTPFLGVNRLWRTSRTLVRVVSSAPVSCLHFLTKTSRSKNSTYSSGERQDLPVVSQGTQWTLLSFRFDRNYFAVCSSRSQILLWWKWPRLGADRWTRCSVRLRPSGPQCLMAPREAVHTDLVKHNAVISLICLKKNCGILKSACWLGLVAGIGVVMFWRVALASVGTGGMARYVGCSDALLWAGLSSLHLPMLQLWMVMGLGMCMHSKGLRGCGCEGPMQDTTLDWIPYPQETEHWRGFKKKVSKKKNIRKKKTRCPNSPWTSHSDKLTWVCPVRNCYHGMSSFYWEICLVTTPTDSPSRASQKTTLWPLNSS